MKISTEAEYRAFMSEIDGLLHKGLANLNAAEQIRLDELSDAVEAWEEIHYPMPIIDLPKKEVH